MKYDLDIYYSSQNEPYEKHSGYIIDEPTLFCMAFSTDEYTFEIKRENDKVSVLRKGEQSYCITLSSNPTSFSLKTPFGAFVYSTQLKSFDVEKKPNAYSLTLVYMLTDSSGHTQENILKMKGRIK